VSAHTVHLVISQITLFEILYDDLITSLVENLTMLQIEYMSGGKCIV